MPAPEVDHRLRKQGPVLGHVNLMADTLIANANVEDLRAIVRTMLSTSPPSVAASFTAAARHRYSHGQRKRAVSPAPLFTNTGGNTDVYGPTKELYNLLAYARSLLGAGMGFESINVLCSVVHATSGLRWSHEGNMADILAVADADISQAIQSCKEQLASDNVMDLNIARTALHNLRSALDNCYAEVETWGGEFPFERGAANADCLEF